MTLRAAARSDAPVRLALAAGRVLVLALISLVCARPSVAAETVITALASEPSVVVQGSALFGATATQLIPLPNGTHLPGNELALACVQQTTTVEALVLYGLNSRRCTGLSEAAPGLALSFTTLDAPSPASVDLLVVMPPGLASVGGLEDLVFANGFE